MIPLAPSALRMLSQRILAQLVPDAKSPYNMSDGMLVGVLLGSLVNEMEAGIERRLQDMRAMKALFERTRAMLDNDELPAGFDKVLALRPASMTMQDVNAAHDAHTRLLMAIHDRVDTPSAGEAAATLNLAIWQYLGDHAARHALDI